MEITKMNKLLIILIIAIGFDTLNGKAQDSLEIARDFREIVRLIKTDSTSKLAKLVNFPLKRPNPIQDILTANDFALYAPLLFDSSFKSKLLSYNDSIIFYHNGYYGLVGGLFHGDIWINENGLIESINTHSAAELELQMKLTHEIQRKIYPSIKAWMENVLVCETDKFLIRVDLLDNYELRYVAWNKPKKIDTKPDLVLNKGVQEFHGTMGGVSYTFKNDKYYYQIDQRDMGESDDQVGLFLHIFKSRKDLEQEKYFVSYKCHELK
jgi:hypothetical protein